LTVNLNGIKIKRHIIFLKLNLLVLIYVFIPRLSYIYRPHGRGCSRCAEPGPWKSRGPTNLKFRNWYSQLCTKFLCYNFIYTILCKL